MRDRIRPLRGVYAKLPGTQNVVKKKGSLIRDLRATDRRKIMLSYGFCSSIVSAVVRESLQQLLLKRLF